MYKLLKLGLKAFASNFKTLKEPYKLTFAVTYRCNSKCKICNIWQRELKKELTLEEIKKFFNKNSFLWVNLTGGEDFIRDDLVEIIKNMRGVYLLNITTNGILTEKITRDCKEIQKMIPRFILTVSIDGPKNLHNKLRGIDCWDKAINTYQNMKKEGIESYIGYTFSPYNIDKINETFDEIKNKVPDFKIKDLHINFYHESDFYFNNKGKIKKNLDYEKKLIEQNKKFIKLKKGFDPVSFLEFRFIKHVEKYLEKNKSPLLCKALNSSCYIDPYWNVYPCIIYNKKLGNLKDTNYDLKEIWKSGEAKKIRKIIKEYNCDGCWTPCEAYQTILGNIFQN